MKYRLIILTFVTLLILVTLAATGCAADNSDNKNETTGEIMSTDLTPVTSNPITSTPVTTGLPATEDNTFRLSDYAIIRVERASKSMVSTVKNFKKQILDKTGFELDVKTDEIRKNEVFDETLPEILIGLTTRTMSKEIYDKLVSDGESDYYIGYKDNKFVIIGENDELTTYAMREFLANYIGKDENSDFQLGKELSVFAKADPNKTVLSNFVMVDKLMSANVMGSRKGGQYMSTYGRVIELKHNGENNGMLYATSQWAGTNFPVYRSTDGGKTWKLHSTVSEQFTPNLAANWQPEIFELPNQVGDMPEGTLLLAGCSHEGKVFKMCIWKSLDLGKTWEEICVVDEATEGKGGMYEPFLICDEDGSLVCFYSDETEVHEYGGQQLVFKVSKDGINWGEKQFCVAPNSKNLRPGMVTVAKMGDHGYIMTYEMIGLTRGDVYTKVSKSLTNWEDVTDYGKRVTDGMGGFSGATPYCTWTPDGGEYGTVIAAGRFGDREGKEMSALYLSFDLGETWITYENPLPYDYHKEAPANYAYSFGFSVGADGSVYYINNVFPDYEPHKYLYADLKIAKLKIIELK